MASEWALASPSMALAKNKQTEDHDLRRSTEKEASYNLSPARTCDHSNHDF
jgi:hypothetical protein